MRCCVLNVNGTIKKGNEIVKKVTLVAEKDIDKQSFISMYFSNLKTILFG